MCVPFRFHSKTAKSDERLYNYGSVKTILNEICNTSYRTRIRGRSVDVGKNIYFGVTQPSDFRAKEDERYARSPRVRDRSARIPYVFHCRFVGPINARLYSPIIIKPIAFFLIFPR